MYKKSFEVLKSKSEIRRANSRGISVRSVMRVTGPNTSTVDASTGHTSFISLKINLKQIYRNYVNL